MSAGYALFDAERVRRQSLIDRGDDEDEIEPWPLDIWHADEDDEDTFVARDGEGKEICRVEFFGVIPGTDTEGELARAEVTFPGEATRLVEIEEVGAGEIAGMDACDLHTAMWEQANLAEASKKRAFALLAMMRAKFGDARFRGILDDPDPDYDHIREMVEMERQEAERKLSN